MKGVLAAALMVLGGRAGAQIPEKFENLLFFPKDIPRDSLVANMVRFSLTVGVRCVYCHVGEDSPTLAGVNFKSDEKQAKRTAREMLRMVEEINQRLSALPPHEGALEVRCLTCHRGVPRPITLEDSLYRVAGTRAGAGVVAAYDSLRTDYYGRSAFDFGPQPLVRLAERLYRDKRHQDAVAVLQRNAEVNPNFWNTYWELGRNYEALDRKADAIGAYQAVLQRLPNHPGAQARLKALQG